MKDVVGASRDLGAASLEGAHLQAVMMNAWMSFVARGREVSSILYIILLLLVVLMFANSHRNLRCLTFSMVIDTCRVQ